MADKMKAHLQDALYVPVAWVRQNPGVLAAFTYTFTEAVSFGWNADDYTMETDVCMYRQVGDYYAFARGDIEKLYSLFADLDIQDERSNVPWQHPIQFTGQLRPWQKVDLRKYCNPNIGGILEAPPGYGKTVVMVAYATMLQQNMLLVVPKADLRDQFVEKFRSFTNVAEIEKQTGQKLVGELWYDDQGNARTYPVTVSTYQLIIQSRDRLPQLKNKFGLVVVDECHRAPADSLTRIVRSLNPMIFMGVSATPERKDGYHRLLPDLVGPVRVESEVENTAVVRFLHGQHFEWLGANAGWTTVLGQVLRNASRNRLICENIQQMVQQGRRVIALTSMVNHAEVLFQALKGQGLKAGWLVGASSKDVRNNVLARVDALEQTINLLKQQSTDAENFNWDVVKDWQGFWSACKTFNISAELLSKINEMYEQRIDVLVATSRLLGEGSDIPAADTLFICAPMANKVNLEQYIGRIQRSYARKKSPLAFYIADTGHGILYGCASSMKKQCEALKYKVEKGPEPLSPMQKAAVLDFPAGAAR